jgi:hypothetical protein
LVLGSTADPSVKFGSAAPVKDVEDNNFIPNYEIHYGAFVG